MLYAYRTCGISLGKYLSLDSLMEHKNLSLLSLGHIECIRSESCTDFLTLLFDLFGENPSQDVLKGVVIDRACDVHPYCKRLGREGHHACRFYSENLTWIVDPFHIKGHIGPIVGLERCFWHAIASPDQEQSHRGLEKMIG